MNDERTLMGDEFLLGPSDWDDQDLLTSADARVRVRAELDAERAKFRPDEARIRALEETVQRLTTTPQPDDRPEAR